MKTLNTRFAIAAALLLSTASWAHADELARPGDVGFHPATSRAARPSFDASAMMVGHPASPRNAAMPQAGADRAAVAEAKLPALQVSVLR